MGIHDLIIINHGHLAVFALVALESLGVPVPGETVLIAAGVYAGLNHSLSPLGIVAVASAGAIIGDTIGFWIGDKGGCRLLRRYGHYIRFDEPKIKVARYLFDRHGGKVVFFGRFVGVLRTYAAFLAGTSRMRYRYFLMFNAAGGIVWAAAFGFASYYAGKTVQRLSETLTIVFGVLAFVGFVVGILFIRRRMKDLISRAEDAYPEPLDDQTTG